MEKYILESLPEGGIIVESLGAPSPLVESSLAAGLSRVSTTHSLPQDSTKTRQQRISISSGTKSKESRRSIHHQTRPQIIRATTTISNNGGSRPSGVRHISSLHGRSGLSRTTKVLNRPDEDNKNNRLPLFKTEVDPKAQRKLPGVAQMRCKVLSWLLNYTQSNESLAVLEGKQHGIHTLRTFFLATELLDFGLQATFIDTSPWGLVGDSITSRPTEGPEATAWLITAAAFKLAAKTEEPRTTFDRVDFEDLWAFEGPPPGIRMKKHWDGRINSYEERFVHALNWRVSEAYEASTLGQFECLIDFLAISPEGKDRDTRMRIQIVEALLQFSSLLLPEWMYIGLKNASDVVDASLPSHLVNTLRAIAAWVIALHFSFPVDQSPTLKATDGDANDPSRFPIQCGEPSSKEVQLSYDFLRGLLKIHQTGNPLITEAIRYAMSITDHLKSLLVFMIEFSVTMESHDCISAYQHLKTIRKANKTDHTEGVPTTTPPPGIRQKVPRSLLVPLISAHRSILKRLSQRIEPIKNVLVPGRVQHDEWLQRTFKEFLGYTLRCSQCGEYGHNKTVCPVET